MDLRREYEARRVLVTGAAGFIGSHLVDTLTSLGAEVLAVDDLSDGYLGNLAESMDRISWREGSILDPAFVDAALEGQSIVFHLAANASVPRSSNDPSMDFRINVVGSENVLAAIRRRPATRLVFTSSAAVYGEPRVEPMDESHPYFPKSPYGGSKLAAEFLLEANSRCFQLDIRRVRLFNTYGPRQRKYVMFDLLEKLRARPEELQMLGTGAQIRDYGFVADTVQALLLVGAHEAARGEVYNVAGDRAIDIRELVSLMVGRLGIPAPRVSYSGESWPGDIARWVADTTKLRALGFVPRVALEEGVDALISWHRREFHPPW